MSSSLAPALGTLQRSDGPKPLFLFGCVLCNGRYQKLAAEPKPVTVVLPFPSDHKQPRERGFPQRSESERRGQAFKVMLPRTCCFGYFLVSAHCPAMMLPKRRRGSGQATAVSQFRGGIIMGLGLALTEETLFDEHTGRVMNPSLAEYHVPVHLDVPEIDVIWNDIPDPHSPLGLHGIREIALQGRAAVADAAITQPASASGSSRSRFIR